MGSASMKYQENYIALDWLTPALEEACYQLIDILHVAKTQEQLLPAKTLAHQITGTLKLSQLDALLVLAECIENFCQHIIDNQAAFTHKQTLIQAVNLLIYEIERLKVRGQKQSTLIIQRVNYLRKLLGQAVDSAATVDALELIKLLPAPENPIQLSAKQLTELVKYWRHYTLVLLKNDEDKSTNLLQLAKICDFLAKSTAHIEDTAIWQMVALWLRSLVNNPTSNLSNHHYLWAQLDELLQQDAFTQDVKHNLLVDVFIHLERLQNQSDVAQKLIAKIVTPIKMPKSTSILDRSLATIDYILAVEETDLDIIIKPLIEVEWQLEVGGWDEYKSNINKILQHIYSFNQVQKRNKNNFDTVLREVNKLKQDIVSTIDSIEQQLGTQQVIANAKEAVLRQTRLAVEQVKQIVSSYGYLKNIHHLTSASKPLQNVSGAFAMMQLDEPHTLIKQLIEFFNKISEHQLPAVGWEHVDAIAEIIAGFELFLDRLVVQVYDDALLLQVRQRLEKATQLLEALIINPIEVSHLAPRNTQLNDDSPRYDDSGEVSTDSKSLDVADLDVNAVKTTLPETNNESLATDTASSVDLFVEEKTTHEFDIDINEEQNSYDEFEAEIADFSLPDDIEIDDDQLDKSGHRDIDVDAYNTASLAQYQLVETPELLAAREQLVDDDFSMDEDIREIFIEESEEVLETLQEYMPQWQADLTELTILKEIRRGFHTLKGSGRMVGANQTGEMAWAVENLLNRVLEERIPTSQDLFDLVAETQQVIPVLVHDYAQKQPPSIDPAVVIAKANQLLNGQPIDVVTKPVAKVQTEHLAVDQASVDKSKVDTAHSTVKLDDSGQAQQPISTDDTKLSDLPNQPQTGDVMVSGAESTLDSVLENKLNAIQTQFADAVAEISLPNDVFDDAEISEIFVEEAEEVVQNISEIWPKVQADRTALDALKEVRRGFHTLKGSGRMVGAHTVGELAWSIENMLNRVLDNNITLTQDVIALVSDVISILPEMVADFANEKTSQHNIAAFMVVANAYASNRASAFAYASFEPDMATHVNVETDSLPTPSPAQLSPVTDVSEVMVDSKTTLAGVDEPVADSVVNVVSVDQRGTEANINTDDVALDATELDEVRQIFIEEAHELLDVVVAYTQPNPVGTQIPDDLVRAFHTIRGGAGVNDMQPLHDISAAMEASCEILLENETPVSATQIEFLNSVVARLKTHLVTLENKPALSVQPLDEQILAQIPDVMAGMAECAKTKIQVADLIALGIDDLLDAQWELESKLSINESQTGVYATTLLEQIKQLSEQVSSLPKFISVLTEMAGLYQLVKQNPEFANQDSLIDVLLSAHALLTSFFDALAAGQQVQLNHTVLGDMTAVYQDLVKQVQEKQTTTTSVDISADTPLVQQPVQSEPMPVTQPEVEVLKDMDEDLLAIFLEEAQELLEEIETSFSQWHANPTNTEALASLQRYLHTMKGGARMAGIQSVGDLTHEAEYVYEALVEQKLKPTPNLVSFMRIVQDRLAEQIAYIEDYQQSLFAEDLKVKLQAVLAGETVTLFDETQPVAEIEDQSTTALATEFAEVEMVQHVAESEDDTDTADFAKIADSFSVAIDAENQPSEDTPTTMLVKGQAWQGEAPDEDMLAIFLDEAEELVDSSSTHNLAFRNNTSDVSVLATLQRELHTIKGGARMVGVKSIGDLAHSMESVYEDLVNRRKPATKMVGQLLAMCHDWLADALVILSSKQNPQYPDVLIDALQQFMDDPDSVKTLPSLSIKEHVKEIQQQEVQATQIKNDTLLTMPSMDGLLGDTQEHQLVANEMIRVPARLMEDMINLSGESAINRARIDMGITSLTNTIEDMGVTIQRLADQLRRMDIELEAQILAQIDETEFLDADFDPLEMDQYSALNQLSKSLSESASDLLDFKTTMLEKTRDTENLLLQLSRTQNELQEGLMNSRLVPFSRLTPRLQRIVRQTSNELRKSVELNILNEDGELDRTILERITSPLEHMLRNAVDHGIEPATERSKMDKPSMGKITIDITREGNEIVISLEDDGKGIDVEAVRKKAVERGLIDANEHDLTDVDVMQYIFNAGLSTASSVTQISGRGVGMDVVQSEIKQLGGVVTVMSELGKGSRFTMRLPLTVAVSDALVVRSADRYFALPLVQIERVVRVNVEKVSEFYTSKQNDIVIEGNHYRFRYLNNMLHGSEFNPLTVQSESLPVVIVKNPAGQQLAILVDELSGSRTEVVVKPLGHQLAGITGISSATIMADGSVLFILDLLALSRHAPVNRSSETTVVQEVIDAEAEQSVRQDKQTIMVVDDSVTVRKVTSRLLERQGYIVQLAKDGLDALEIMQELTPDLVLLDIEMPRLDGFEVATQMRHHSRLKNIPIIMITSRTGEKHRERALSLGVNDYMGKPFQENQLVEAIQSFLGSVNVVENG